MILLASSLFSRKGILNVKETLTHGLSDSISYVLSLMFIKLHGPPLKSTEIPESNYVECCECEFLTLFGPGQTNTLGFVKALA